ncbi:uncharacterized protein J4E92_009698 [Alternaria infectoria]|uniref:uncharacterized protein n=1 Tax=Alternaria infectoria TaxID=45303 RepID=UPI0022201FF7|nr:uncharacterized protein J4E92_009698 [Alternaria infectoria]KAI4914284.1 hypothetical protein J4E92_009698 [Alternaria infectoria]
MSLTGAFRIGADDRESEKKRFEQHITEQYPEANNHAAETGEEFRNRIHRAWDNLCNAPASVQELALWSDEEKKFQDNQLQISLKQQFQEGRGLVEEMQRLVEVGKTRPREIFKREQPDLKLYTVSVKIVPEDKTLYPDYSNFPTAAAWAQRDVRMDRYREFKFQGMRNESVELFLQKEAAISYAKQLRCGHELEIFDIDPKLVDRVSKEGSLQQHRAINEASPKTLGEPRRVIMLNHTLVYVVSASQV